MTPIADMVASMLAQGVADDLIVLAIRTAELSGTSPGQVRDNRRAYERGRKRLWRENRNKINDVPKANDVGASATMSPDLSRNVPDNAKNRCDLSSLLTVSQQGIQEVREGKQTVVVDRGKRGTRLALDWRPSDADRAFAIAHGVDSDKLLPEFIDFWTAIPGARGCKLDWSATWRNRVRNIETQKGKSNGRGNVIEAADKLVAKLREFERGDEPDMLADLRGRAGPADVRMLPPVRRG